MKIKYGMILAAGLGKRMQPLTFKTPKPLLENNNTSLLERAKNLLVSHGVQQISINVHHLPDQIKSFINKKKFKVRITISHEEDFLFYPGTCRRLTEQERIMKLEKDNSFAWRLNIRAAAKKIGNLVWEDIRLGSHTVPVGTIGDVVLARKDILTSYHLSVTLDDHIQRIGLVSRGEDLVSATHIHKMLQMLLGLKTPIYFHHPLILDSNGKRLSKRNRAQTLKSLKAKGYKREDVIDLFGRKNIISLLDLIK